MPGYLFDDTQAIQELLRGPEWRLMQLLQAIDQPEAAAEFAM